MLVISIRFSFLILTLNISPPASQWSKTFQLHTNVERGGGRADRAKLALPSCRSHCRFVTVCPWPRDPPPAFIYTWVRTTPSLLPAWHTYTHHTPDITNARPRYELTQTQTRRPFLPLCVKLQMTPPMPANPHRFWRCSSAGLLGLPDLCLSIRRLPAVPGRCSHADLSVSRTSHCTADYDKRVSAMGRAPTGLSRVDFSPSRRHFGRMSEAVFISRGSAAAVI